MSFSDLPKRAMAKLRRGFIPYPILQPPLPDIIDIPRALVLDNCADCVPPIGRCAEQRLCAMPPRDLRRVFANSDGAKQRAGRQRADSRELQ